MPINTVLNEIVAHGLGDSFQEKICLLYKKRDEAGDYGDIEKQYNTTILRLLPNLSNPKQEIYKQYEEHQNEVRSFSARYGFLAGLYCGFMQYFTSDQSTDGGFDKFVSSQIFMIPNMCNYSNNYNHITQKNILYSKLLENENDQISSYLVVVDYTWSQRCYSASIDGFYCGYRAALAILDMVGHLKHEPKTITDKLHVIEQFWGFPRSMIQTELQ